MISIIVPVYNQEKFLEECLSSVVSQTYKNWECLIIDDGSVDNSKSVALKWVEIDSRFKYFYKDNSGVASTRNYGISRAKGPWILPLDGDDCILKDYLEFASRHFDDSDIKIIYCKASFFGDRQGDWHLPDFNFETFADHNIIFNTAFFRKSDWEAVGGYDVNLIYGMEDWDFWLSMLKTGGKVFRIDKVCFKYRITKSTRSKLLDRSRYTASLDIIDRKHIDFFQKHLPPLHRLLYDNRDLKKVLNSKRYKVVNKILKIVNL